MTSTEPVAASGEDTMPAPPATALSEEVASPGASSLNTARLDAASPPYSLRIVSLVLALACGLTVANLYYAQPLLHPIAVGFGVSQTAATVVITLTQLGYALGMALVLPLGDMIENRTLASRTLLATAAALLIAGLSRNFGLFLAMSVLVGVTSVVTQILVPFAAHLAPPEQRGQFVGRVMSGLLLGILLARTLSSLVAAQWGWRSIYLVSAVLMVALSLLLRRVLPRREPEHQDSYLALLRSVGTLIRTEPLLRRRALSQALMFGAFSCYWTTIAYELVDHHGLSQREIGVFALVGAAGAAAAPLAGRLGDRGHGRSGRLAAFVVGAIAMLVGGLGQSSVIALAVAGVLLDLAVQGHQVLSQRDIYALNGDARARINTVFMTTVFLGGAVASVLAGLLDHAYGWTGVTIFAGVLPLLGIAVWWRGVRVGEDGAAADI